MSAWMNDAAPNQNGNGFPQMNDSNPAAATMDPSAFMADPFHAQFNAGVVPFPNQQQAPQHQQQGMPGMQNGPMRNASPSFQNPAYQTNSVIPSKRPRPREDSIAGSPRQNSGMLPTSRSETPQQSSPFPGFQPGAVPQQTPGQFPHLQSNGSANASPSPVMGNQMRQGSAPQRVATASPHPFSPNPQQFGSQTSPVPSEQGTPQPNPYLQNMPQGYNPNFAPSPSNPRPSPNPNAMSAGQMMPQNMGQMPQHMAQMPNNMYAQMPQQQQQHQQQQQQQQQPASQQPQQQQAQAQTQLNQQQQQPGQQRQPNMSDQQKMAAYQMRLQQQLQGNMQVQAQMQAQNMGRGMAPKQQMPNMPNGQSQQGAARPQQRTPSNANPEQFMKSLAMFMHNKGLPLEQSPVIGDRPVNLMMLFQMVQSKGGYKNVTAGNGWNFIAQSMGLAPHNPAIAPALKQAYERNLQAFEEVWVASQKQRMQQQAGMASQQATPQKQTPQQQRSASTSSQTQPGQQQQQQQQQQQSTPGPNATKANQAPVNGFSTPQAQHQQQQLPMPGHQRQPSAAADLSAGSPARSRPGSVSMIQGNAAHGHGPPGAGVTQPAAQLPQKSDEYTPAVKHPDSYGGLYLDGTNKLGSDVERYRPDVPPLDSMGDIDVAALTRSLQSGINAEVRLALDSLAVVSNSPNQYHFLQLKYCDDLVDALIDCAGEQLEELAEATAEVSDEIQLTSYEDVARQCVVEQWAVQNVPPYGSMEYSLDRAVEKLLCITTILRNVSFPGENNENHIFLIEETVIKFLCVIIRYLGTRTMLLRTNQNTIDFMKDLVILLSNIAPMVEIPGREQAFCLLQFLLTFAPSTGSSTTSDGAVFFHSYDPTIHPYLPHAVDSLAKFLARDEPNRSLYKSLFASDTPCTSPHELLTRTFALATSPIPEKNREWSREVNYPPVIEMRKPFLMQGLLAADILASLAPGPDSGLAQSWLLAGNGWAQLLFRLIRELSYLYEHPPMPPRSGPKSAPPRRDPELVYLVTVAASLLRRLGDKARDSNDPRTAALPATLMPPREALRDALTMQAPDWTKEGFLQQLTAVVGMTR